MPTQPEYIVSLNSLLAQMSDASVPTLARIAASTIARTYLEALTIHLVGEAIDGGATWLEIADLFATSEQNVRARFGSLH